MSLKNVKEGTYRGKAVRGAWMKRGDKQTPCVGIQFEFKDGENVETIPHFMYFTDTAWGEGTVASRTFDILAMLGYDEKKPLKIDGENKIFDKDHLADKEVELVLEKEVDSRDAAKSYLRVKWINELGGNQMEGVGVEQVLGNRSLAAEMAAARARTGHAKPAAKPDAKPASQPAQTSFTEEDIPF